MNDIWTLIFYYTGMAAWSLIWLCIFWLLYEIGRAFVTTCSFVRWAFRLCYEHRGEPPRYVVRGFFSTWWHFIGHRNTGSTKWSSKGGYWCGIGDWQVNKPIVKRERDL